MTHDFYCVGPLVQISEVPLGGPSRPLDESKLLKKLSKGRTHERAGWGHVPSNACWEPANGEGGVGGQGRVTEAIGHVHVAPGRPLATVWVDVWVTVPPWVAMVR